MLKTVRNENEFTHDLYQLNKLVKGSGILNSEVELDAFFGELKSAVILVDSACKITYLNKTAISLSNNDSRKEPAKKTAPERERSPHSVTRCALIFPKDFRLSQPRNFT